MKSFIQEAEQVSGFGHEFVVKARTVAAMFGVPVEWLLAAMSWETSQYKAYHAGNGGSAPHWSTNTSDAGGGLIGFTPFTPAIAAKDPIGQLDDVQIYFQNTIKHFRIPTPFATPEDFYSVVYAPGISGKPDNYTWQYMGKTYTKKTQLNIYSNFLKGYDMPDPPGGDEILGLDGSFLWWAPGQKKKTGWAKTTEGQVGVRSGPGTNFPIIQWLGLSGTRVQVSDQIRGSEMIEGSALWDKVDSGYVSDSSLAFE